MMTGEDITTTTTAPLPANTEAQITQAYFVNPPKKGEMASSIALFGFSLGLDYHTGKNLKAIIDLAKGCGLTQENTIFLVGDRLQVYNIAAMDPELEPDSPEVIAEADALGDKWIADNTEVLQNINLHRWRDFVTNEEFLLQKDNVSRLYQEKSVTGEKFKEGIDKTANIVFDRFKRNKATFPDEKRAKKLFVEFVLEECALFAYLAAKYDIRYMAYPSAMPDSLDVTKRYIVNDDTLLKWVQIKIKTYDVVNNDSPNGELILRRHKKSAELPRPRQDSGGSSSSSKSSDSGSDSSGSDDEIDALYREHTFKKMVADVNDTIELLIQTKKIQPEEREKYRSKWLAQFAHKYGNGKSAAAEPVFPETPVCS